MASLTLAGCVTPGDKNSGLGGKAKAEARLGRSLGDVPPDVREPCVPVVKPGSRDKAIVELGLQVIACDEKRARAVQHLDNVKANLEPGKASVSYP